ncbi:methyl-accepting chemotaxis protein, partial [bacterium]|nr:methyl-accepting chemotaxis protein [bacterium]
MGLSDGVWSRATLLARLTIAGLVAAVLLALVFGVGVAHMQKISAIKREQERSLKAARSALLALDRDVFAKDNGSSDLVTLIERRLRDTAELLDARGIALVQSDGKRKARYLGSARTSSEKAPEWNVEESPNVRKRLQEGPAGATDGGEVLLGDEPVLESIVANQEAVLIDVNSTEDERRGVPKGREMGAAYIVTLRSLEKVNDEVATQRLVTLFEAFLAAVVLLVIVLWNVSREVAGPVVAISRTVSDLARTGDLAPARGALVAFGGGNGATRADDRNELKQLVCGFDALLAHLERLAMQANAIARDDLWNEAFDRDADESRGDLGVAFRKMVSMLRDLSIRVRQIARGDLTVPASAPGQKEGSLGSAFREMTEKLKLLLDELAGAGSKIDKAARGLQESSRDQASTATEQAAAVTETMATMEELAASSGHIADTAKHVVQLADETLLSARNGQASVTDVGGGMDEIVAASRQGAHRLLDLGEKSRSIGKVAE